MSELRPDFGDVTAEYWAARSGSGLVTGATTLVWARGGDTIEFLDGQLSQDLKSMVPGQVARSFLLEPRGKLIAIIWVLRGEDRVGMAVDAGLEETLISRLEEFRFRVDVDFEVDDRPSHELWGKGAPSLAVTAGLDPGPGWSETGDRLVAALPGRALARVLLLGEPAPLLAAGARSVGAVALSTVRLEAGEPVMGVDLDQSVIPQESGLVPEAVSFSKGCYVGQELVARIDSRGRVNRRLAGLLIGTNVLPPIGAEVIADGEVRGTVSRVGESLALRAPVAWGLIRREVAAGDDVAIRWQGGTAPAVLRELPLDDFSDRPHTPLTEDADTRPDRAGA